MGLLDGKVAIVTGAGRGLGRTHALLLAAEGARVVVNDLGGEWDGAGTDNRPAAEVVEEIKAAGGDAVANYESCSNFKAAENLVNQAVETFGGLDILVNNAGILRDKMSYNMSEEDWDSVIDVHLKGHFATTHFAGSYWRARSKAGEPGFYAIIPILNTLTILKIAGKPWWWLFLFMIPFANFVAIILVKIALAESFGQGAGFGIGLLLLPVVFYPLLAFGSSQYMGPGGRPAVMGYGPPAPGFPGGPAY